MRAGDFFFFVDKERGWGWMLCKKEGREREYEEEEEEEEKRGEVVLCVVCLYCIIESCFVPSGQAPSYETSLGHKFICTQTP